MFGTTRETLRHDYDHEPRLIIIAVWGAMLILLLLALFFTEVNPLK
jgi:hypothetical protein